MNRMPDGWRKETLGSVSTFASGGTPAKNTSIYWGGNIPWISASSMRGIEYETSELMITQEGLQSGSKLAEKNTLLLLVRGSMLWNKIPVGIAKRDLAFNQDVKSIKPNIGIDTYFLLYWFLANENNLLNMVVGTGIGAGKLDTAQLLSMDIMLPPNSEQTKIAKILSTWDKAIETTEKLISNSQQQKKSLMCQLLMGKRRFPRLNQLWQKIKLKDILKGKKCKGRMVETNENFEGFPYIGSASFEGSFNLYTTSNSFVKCILEDILILWDGENAGKVATGLVGAVSSTVVKLELKKMLANHKFVTFSLLKDNYKIRKIREGSGIPHMPGDFEDWYKFSLPPIEEQQKIVTVLSTADFEIKILQKKLNHLKQEKQALMQQLLTGKRRVKIDSPVTNNVEVC